LRILLNTKEIEWRAVHRQGLGVTQQGFHLSLQPSTYPPQFEDPFLTVPCLRTDGCDLINLPREHGSCLSSAVPVGPQYAKQNMAVELSVLVATGPAGHWAVDMYDYSTDTWTEVGVLASAGDSWTLVSLAVPGSDLTVYVVATEWGDQMLVRVYNKNPGGQLVRFCSYKPSVFLANKERCSLLYRVSSEALSILVLIPRYAFVKFSSGVQSPEDLHTVSSCPHL